MGHIIDKCINITIETISQPHESITIILQVKYIYSINNICYSACIQSSSRDGRDTNGFHFDMTLSILALIPSIRYLFDTNTHSI